MHSERRVIAYLAFLSVVLAFGVDTALPAFDELRDEFGLKDGSGEVSLVITWYLLGMAAGQMLWGLLSDRFGRRPIVLTGLLLYTAGALGGALSGSFDVVLAFRFIWGLGAAAPGVLRAAIARDLYAGDQMARVIALVMAVFLLGPAVAPAIGQGILVFGSWETVFLGSVPLAGVAVAWTLRFEESLPPDRRRPIDLRATGRGVRAVVRTRVTMGYTLAATFTFGAFFIYLGSSQPIIDEIYGHGDYFALIFGTTAIFLAAAVFAGERVIRRHGADQVSTAAVCGLLIVSAVFTLTAVGTDGVPPFGVWLVCVGLLGACSVIFTPTSNAVAMLPMERVAGAASGVFGVVTLGGGALLATIWDRQIDDTVTPMAVGNLLYSAVALCLTLWARAGSVETVDPEARIVATVSPTVHP